MAIELESGAFGLLDPFGGREHLARGRLSVLHPLSYVEDPTRMFRAARYAARLGLAPDRATRAAQALALRLVPYPVLSGQRLAAELGLVLGEARPDAVLVKLGATGVGKLLDPRYRFTEATRRRCGALAATLGWALDRGLVALAGEGVVALGVPRGPGVAQVLAELRDGRLDGRLRNRAIEVEFVRQWTTKGG